MTRLTEADLQQALSTHEVISDTSAIRPKAANIPSSEHNEQVTLFQWASLNVGRWPCLSRMFAIPNGGHRHPAVAGRLKAEGVKAGVPDIFLPWPVSGWCGLWIEMKYGRNKPTKKQRDWLAWLGINGYKTATCWGAEEAIRVIEEYLGGGS